MKTNSLISLLKYSSNITLEKRKALAAVVGSHSEVNSHIPRKHFMSLQCFRLFGAMRFENPNSLHLKMDNPELVLFRSHPLVLYFSQKFVQLGSCLQGTLIIDKGKY